MTTRQHQVMLLSREPAGRLRRLDVYSGDDDQAAAGRVRFLVAGGLVGELAWLVDGEHVTTHHDGRRLIDLAGVGEVMRPSASRQVTEATEAPAPGL